MKAISFTIAQIVEQVNSARGGAKNDERGEGASYEPGLGETLCEDERGENENVLDPLGGPHGDQERADHAAYYPSGDFFTR